MWISQTNTGRIDRESKRSLLRLPPEVREMIYFYLFSATRFSYGERKIGPERTTYVFGTRRTEPGSAVRVTPAPNNLAIVYTCRRIREEIRNPWFDHSLFAFEDPVTMMDKLSALPPDILSRIRHVQVFGDDVKLYCPEYRDYHWYPLVSLLKLLPGLKLDELTVLGCDLDHVNYATVSRLIKYGNGWKKLYFLSRNSAMLGYPSDQGWSQYRHEYLRKPQPEEWQRILEERDGRDTNPSVTVYRAIEPGREGCMFDPQHRVVYHQNPPEKPNERWYVFAADPELTGPVEGNKEMMVVVERGAGADYEEKEDSPLISDDLRRRETGKRWARAQAVGRVKRASDGETAPESGDASLCLNRGIPDSPFKVYQHRVGKRWRKVEAGSEESSLDSDFVEVGSGESSLDSGCVTM